MQRNDWVPRRGMRVFDSAIAFARTGRKRRLPVRRRVRHRVGLRGRNRLLHVLRLQEPDAASARLRAVVLGSEGQSARAGRRTARPVSALPNGALRGVHAQKRDVELQSDARGRQTLRVGSGAFDFTVRQRSPVREPLRRSKHALLRAGRNLLWRACTATRRMRRGRRLPDRKQGALRVRAVRPLRNAGVRARLPHPGRLLHRRRVRRGPSLRTETMLVGGLWERPPLLERRRLPAERVHLEPRLRRILRERLLLRSARQLRRRERAVALPAQNSAEPGVRAKGMTSRMFFMPVKYMSIRSSPSPKPA